MALAWKTFCNFFEAPIDSRLKHIGIYMTTMFWQIHFHHIWLILLIFRVLLHCVYNKVYFVVNISISFRLQITLTNISSNMLFHKRWLVVISRWSSISTTRKICGNSLWETYLYWCVHPF